MIKEIMLIPNWTIEQWQSLIIRYSEGQSIAKSTISGWRSGKQGTSSKNKKLLIKVLCEQQEMKQYELTIRQRLMAYLDIRQYQKLYWDLNDKNYEEFLNYVLFDLKPDDIRTKETNWDKIVIPVLVELCIQKAEVLYSRLYFQIREEGGDLLLTYVYNKTERCTIPVGIRLGKLSIQDMEKECNRLFQSYESSLMRYLFVTQDVADELYLEMLECYKVYLLKIDFYDMDTVKVIEGYIIESHSGLDDTTLHFMNVLSEVILHKISGMNLVVLKEILCRAYDYNKIGEHFFRSNAGLWNYQYPVRRALAFEEKQIKQKLRLAAGERRRKFEILDLNLAGGLLGVRCGYGVGNVTCVDITPAAVEAKRRIIKRYWESKGHVNDESEVVHHGYLRMDTMKIVGAEVPKDGYDLIILGLGGGSYIPNLEDFLKQVGGWLKKGKDDQEAGIIMLSVFNEEALCFLESQAMMDFSYDHGIFRYRQNEWPLPAKLYTYKDICHRAMKYYEVLEGYSYPTILSVISDHYQREILDKLKEIDKDYASRDVELSNRGLFNTLFLKKISLESVPQCYLNIKKYISEQEIILQTIQHEEIISRAKMVRELSRHNVLAGDNFVKTVVLVDERYNMLIYYLLPLNKKFKKQYLEQWYRINRYELVKNKLRFCKETELQTLGLTTGSVSPFSYPVVHTDGLKYLICDKEVQYSRYQTLYTYSGDLEITYKIGKSSFMTFLKKNNAQFV